MSDFVSVRKEKKEKQTKKISQLLKAHISETTGTIVFKFGMWTTEGGAHFHSKTCMVS